MHEITNYKTTHRIGEISTPASKCSTTDSHIYISYKNRLYEWDPQTIKHTYKEVFNYDKEISSFSTSINFVVCSNDGCVKFLNEENKQFRLCDEKINAVYEFNKLIFFVTKRHVYVYKAEDEKVIKVLKFDTVVVSVTSRNDFVYVVSADKSVRVYCCVSFKLVDCFVVENVVLKIEFADENFTVFYKNGKIEFLDLQTKLKIKMVEEVENKSKNQSKIEKYSFLESKKKLRSIHKVQNSLYFISDLALLKMEIKENTYFLTKIVEVDKETVDFSVLNEKICFLKSTGEVEIFNSKLETRNVVKFHESKIIGLEVFNSKKRVVTLSSFSFIVWRIEEVLVKQYSILLEEMSSAIAVVDNYFLVCNSTGIDFYSTESGDFVYKMDIGAVKAIKPSKNYIFVGAEKALKLFSKKKEEFAKKSKRSILKNDYREERSHEYVDEVKCMDVAADCSLVAVSLLDTKTYVHSIPSLNLKFTLYGHSLPVSFIKFSPDVNWLISCGMDRLTKVFGLDFGESLKSLRVESNSVEFVNNTDFLVASNHLIGYKKFDVFKKFSFLEPGLISFCGDFIVVSQDRSISILRKSNEYNEDFDDFVDIAIVKQPDLYSPKSIIEFSKLVECENISYESIYDFFTFLNLEELDKLIARIDTFTVFIILNTIEWCIEKDVVLLCRVFLSLVYIHTGLATNNPRFYSVYYKIMVKLKELRMLGLEIDMKNKK